MIKRMPIDPNKDPVPDQKPPIFPLPRPEVSRRWRGYFRAIFSFNHLAP